MVFSGIVEEIGAVFSVDAAAAIALWDGSVGSGFVLRVGATTVLQGAYIGCSIAVNGTCLTVTAFDAGSFTVGLAPETLRRTNLGTLVPGSRVNLERSLPADGRNSGHFVQGHVDDTATILATWREGESLWVRLRVAPRLLAMIVPKGYVALDGTSLTVCDVDAAGSWLTVMLIAHTQSHVTLPTKQVGDAVNVECDVVGKYAARAVEGVAASVAALAATMEGVLRRLDALEARQGL